MRTCGEDTTCKPRREALEGTSPANSILNTYLQDYEKINVGCGSPLVCGAYYGGPGGPAVFLPRMPCLVPSVHSFSSHLFSCVTHPNFHMALICKCHLWTWGLLVCSCAGNFWRTEHRLEGPGRLPEKVWWSQAPSQTAHSKLMITRAILCKHPTCLAAEFTEILPWGSSLHLPACTPFPAHHVRMSWPREVVALSMACPPKTSADGKSAVIP